MKNETLSFIVIVVLLFLLMGPRGESKNYCRSHDSFTFHCHHNDTNTDIYLRRLNAKFDKVLELVDTSSEGVKDKRSIEEAAVEAKIIVSSMLTQLNLFRAGNLRTGFLASIIPNFLRNDDEILFDHQTDAAVSTLTELKNYTKEEAGVFRKTLLERTSSLELIHLWGLSKIRLSLSAIIEECIAKAIIKGNDYNIPRSLQEIVMLRYDELDKDASRIQDILKAIDSGEIRWLYDLEVLIKKLYVDQDELTSWLKQLVMKRPYLL